MNIVTYTQVTTAGFLVVLATVSAGCDRLVTGPDPARNPAAVVDAAWREIDRHYPFFDEKHIDWPAAYTRYRSHVSPITADAELAVVLCDMVRELRSYHADLTTPFTVCGYDNGPHYPRNFAAALVAIAVPRLRSTSGSHFQYGFVDAQVGYIRVPSFVGNGWGDQIDEVLDSLVPARALVIDVRGNRGGNDGNGSAIAARLTTATVTYLLSRFRNGPAHNDFAREIARTVAAGGRRHFGGPVALLTNRDNGSASEDFVAMMRVIPSVFSVGDTTIGNSSNPTWRELPNGWQLRIPQSIQYLPDGTVIEGRGIAPTIAVALSAADSARGVDTILDRAVAELRVRASASRWSPTIEPRSQSLDANRYTDEQSWRVQERRALRSARP